MRPGWMATGPYAVARFLSRWSLVAGAMRITQAEHQAILAQPAVRQSYGAPPPAYAAVGSGDGLAK